VLRRGLQSLSHRTRIAGALLLVGIALVVGSLLPAREMRVAGDGDVPVNVGAGDLGDISAHNSPTVARNPRNKDALVATSRIDSPDFSCAVHVSGDGGRHWTRTRVPIPRGPARKCYAPDAVFAADGTLHVSYMTLQGRGNTPSAAWVASSRDGGRTLSAPRRVTGRLAFQARLTSDPERAGTLYLTWVQARDVGSLRFTGPGNPILIARSDDAGRSWGAPVRVNARSRGRVLAPSAAVGAGGALYVLYLDVGDDRLDYEGGHEGFGGPPYSGRFTLVLGRSGNHGATWQESVVDDHVVPTARFIAFLPPFPSLAVDRASGRIHVAYQDGRLGSADVWLWTLPAGSSSWNTPVRVNDTPRDDRTSQYLPQLGVAPDGRLDVVYYDRRGDVRRNVLNEVSLQSSDDGGRTFGPRLRLSDSHFDSRVGLGSERDLPELGSRIALSSDSIGAFSVWSDTRAGTDATGKQDLYGAAVEARDARTTALVLRYVGAALGLGGVLSIVGPLRRRLRE